MKFWTRWSSAVRLPRTSSWRRRPRREAALVVARRPAGAAHLAQALGLVAKFGSFNLSLEEADMKKLITLLVLVSIAGLIGCNTIEGAGKDIQRGGEAVSDTAKDVKRDM
jgi:entericidin B